MSRSRTIWPMGPDIHVRSWGAHSGKSRELVECHPIKWGLEMPACLHRGAERNHQELGKPFVRNQELQVTTI